jgi:hypothetical protein
MMGWGRLENILHKAACRVVRPRGASTRLIARPSGTLCTASVAEMRSPKLGEAELPKDTPIPI